MTPTTHYDAIVIGAGQAGGPLSTTLARSGWKTALVERVHVGGTCINEGCTPTKTMVASARAAYLARRADMYGVHTGPVSVDMRELRMRQGEMVQSFRKVGERRLAEGHVDLIAGEARFVGPKKLEIRREEGETIFLAAETIVINTGARPADPDLQGLDSVPHF